MALILPRPSVFFQNSPSFQKGASLPSLQALKVHAPLPGCSGLWAGENPTLGPVQSPFIINILANEPAAGPSCFWGALGLKCGLHLAAI